MVKDSDHEPILGVTTVTTYHVNSDGVAGPCKATQGNCPFGSAEDHHDSLIEARKAYEAQQKGSFNGVPMGVTPPIYQKWRLGKKMSKADLMALPVGAIVRWPDFSTGTKTMEDWVKVENGQWQLKRDPQSRLVKPTYLAGAGGNEKATFVSADGQTTNEVGEPPIRAPRKKPEPQWGLIRVSNVTGKVYLDEEFASEKTARKEFARLQQYDYLHHHYELVPIDEARARQTK